MYMHQSRILHVHTSNRRNTPPGSRHGAASPAASLYTISTMAGDTSRLIQEVLGPEALGQYRSSERVFPLRHGDKCYSVSHTSDVTVLAVATTLIGVDVERRLFREAAADLAWALSPEERFEVAISEESRLTEIWTAKEASGKALGVGLGAAPRQILTTPVPDMPGFRIAELPGPDLGVTRVLSYGWWSGNHHVRLAWPVPPPMEGPAKTEHAGRRWGLSGLRLSFRRDTEVRCGRSLSNPVLQLSLPMMSP